MFNDADEDLEERTSPVRSDGGLFHVRDVLPEVLARYFEAPLEQKPPALVFVSPEGVIEAEPVVC